MPTRTPHPFDGLGGVDGTAKVSIVRATETYAKMTSALRVSPIDPFADDFLAAPYPFHAELRDAGPFVWLERYGIWACARHTEV